jgi:hypothetical protein
MDVVAHGSQIAVTAAVHDQRFVTAAEQVAEEFVPPVEPAGVGAQKPFHARDQVGLRRLDHQMKMIRHQAIRMDLPPGFDTSLGQRLAEAVPIRVILEDRFAAITAIHDVVNRAGILHSELASHADELPKQTRSVNKQFYKGWD